MSKHDVRSMERVIKIQQSRALAPFPTGLKCDYYGVLTKVTKVVALVKNAEAAVETEKADHRKFYGL